MIVDEVVCGWLVTAEQLSKFAELEIQRPPRTQHGLVERALTWFDESWPMLSPISTRYPRLADPRLDSYRLMFPTRGRTDIDHRYEFVETDKDRRLREKVMNLSPRITLLLTNAEFVTIPNPASTIILPGEFEVVENIDSGSDDLPISDPDSDEVPLTSLLDSLSTSTDTACAGIVLTYRITGFHVVVSHRHLCLILSVLLSDYYHCVSINAHDCQESYEYLVCHDASICRVR